MSAAAGACLVAAIAGGRLPLAVAGTLIALNLLVALWAVGVTMSRSS